MARGEGCGAGAARLALLLSIIALVLSWQAYRRTGGTIPGLDKPIVHTWNKASAEAATADARDRLLALRTRIESHGDVDRLQKDVADMRSDLERSFEGAGQGARERWEEADRALARLDERLDEGGAQAREALDQALARLREVGRNLPAEREPEPSPQAEREAVESEDGKQ